MAEANRTIEVLPNAEALFHRAAEEVLREAKAAVEQRGAFSVALSGGSTPRGLFNLLATTEPFRSAMPWAQTHFFWVDERHVSPRDAQSNYRMAMESMLSIVPVPSENIHRMLTEIPDAREAATQYESTLSHFFHLAPGEFPRFDLILLGMGADGHTGSLFPGTDALQECRRAVTANWVEKVHNWRITLTLPVLNNARTVIFLVTGPDKAQTLRAVFSGNAQTLFPAQMVKPIDGRLLWLVDQPVGGEFRANNSP